jgi:hypothetical protein
MILVGKRISLNPKLLWAVYVPGALLILMGLLMFIVPKVFVLIIATLMLCAGGFLLYIAGRIRLVMKMIKDKDEVSEIDLPDELHRYLEDEPQRAHWIN